jgi:transposase
LTWGPLQWSQTDKCTAESCLDDWIKRVRSTDIPMLTKFANTLSAPKSGFLAYFDHHITSATIEGINNKIIIMRRASYCFRDLDFFKLKILAIHQAKYALTG